MNWELRWHPFRGEWVLFTSHRGARPWIGSTVDDEEVEVPPDNALAPLGTRVKGRNPDYRGVYTFTNDLPVFSDEAPEPSTGDDLYRTRQATGTAEVICYHHDPRLTMADLDDDEVTAVVLAWRDRTAVLNAMEGVNHVLVFENRGAAVGTSNPHPHCQIYAGSLVYGTMAREAEVAARHHEATGRSLLADVVEREVAGPRTISEGEQFFACVPWFARLAYEVLVLPRTPITSLVDLDDDACRSLALVLRDVVRRYDALWGIRMPYVLAVHQAPVGDHPHYPFHVELHPPLRAPGLMKYLAGPEVGGGSMTNESDPDEKAQDFVPPSTDQQPATPDAALALLADLGDHLRSAVLDARGMDMATIEDETPADTIYAIDKVTDDALISWFEERWTDVEVVSEGLHEPLVLGDPRWTVIVDTIDGTRGLMYDKRSAWSLAAVAPHGGSLRDVVAAVMTELPTTKHALADQYASVRGSGVVEGRRLDLRTGQVIEITPRPSTAVDLEHGFAQVAKFFPPGKAALAEIEGELFRRLGATVVFDDEYIASGGQLHELLTGKDRFVADLRPLVDAAAFACHPYDLCTSMVLQEAGGIVTDPWGDPLDCPLDTTTPVAWVGYANPALAGLISPVLADVLRDHLGR